MYGFGEVTPWLPVAMQPVRPGQYDVVTFQAGPVKKAWWGQAGWIDDVGTRVDVECWRGLNAAAAAAELTLHLADANETIGAMRAEYKFHQQQRAIDASSREALADRLDEAQKKLRDRSDQSTRRVQQLQAGALEAIELIGRLRGGVSDPMMSSHIGEALDAIKRALFPPIE